MPYLTPDEIPEDDDCRPLFIPASSVWLAIVSGALTELTKSWNWEKFGTLTVDECVEVAQAIVDRYYDEVCQDCELPLGGKVLRLDEDGNIQELSEGSWIVPTGDYELPPTPPREESTETERLCAAAANASAVFQLFYENVSDSFNDGLNTAAAIAALGSVVSLALGSTGFGLAAASLITIGQLVFSVFYGIMEFITADLWTEEFNQTFTCVLFACASETDDVVHFDYQCVLETLADATSLTVDLEEVRLFGQIAYLLQWIGSQGLDAAGATTSVVDADCENCDREFCYVIDFSDSDGSSDGVIIDGGTWTSGQGIVGVYGSPENVSNATAHWEFPEELEVYQVGVVYTLASASGANARAGLWALNPVVNYREDYVALDFGPTIPGDIGLYIDNPGLLMGMGCDLNSGTASSTATIKKFVVRYRRFEPLWDPNCEDV